MSKHLLIAGTGRAGTSFLVRYLHHLGLETHLARAGSETQWDETAHAGLEDLPHPAQTDLPYVIKSPWTFQVIHQALESGTLEIDAAIIPLRMLTEAASSRSIIEMQAVRRQLPWLDDMDRTWECYGHTPGGAVYSLNPIDQARLLAVGLHHLLDALVRADVPVIMLSFPRLIEDGDYLYRKLAPVLPATCSPESARLAHEVVADPAKVRVGPEIGYESGRADPSAAPGLTLEGPGPLRLERAVLARRLAEARDELQSLEASLAEARAFAQATVAARESDLARLRIVEAALAEATDARSRFAAQASEAANRLRALQDAAEADHRSQEIEIAALRNRVAELGAGWRSRWRSGWSKRAWHQAAE